VNTQNACDLKQEVGSAFQMKGEVGSVTARKDWKLWNQMMASKITIFIIDTPLGRARDWIVAKKKILPSWREDGPRRTACGTGVEPKKALRKV
jgi:hypothetical protein